MNPSEIPQAVAAAMATASALDLTVEDATIVHASNRLVVRLLPCDVVARISHGSRQVAEFEVALAQRLAQADTPVALLDPRVEPRVYHQGSFVVTLWTYYEPMTPRAIPSADYAAALERLHGGMREIECATPHFTDRVADAQRLVGSRHLTPALADADRGVSRPDVRKPETSDRREGRRRAIAARRAPSGQRT